MNCGLRGRGPVYLGVFQPIYAAKAANKTTDTTIPIHIPKMFLWNGANRPAPIVEIPMTYIASISATWSNQLGNRGGGSVKRATSTDIPMATKVVASHRSLMEYLSM